MFLGGGNEVSKSIIMVENGMSDRIHGSGIFIYTFG